MATRTPISGLEDSEPFPLADDCMVGSERFELSSASLKVRGLIQLDDEPKMVRAEGLEPPSCRLRAGYNEPLYDARMVDGLGDDPN